jgi:hypothetical protein
MGSFDYTCAVSGLPIGAGDDVRLMLLTQNPYHHGKKAGAMTCGMNDVWFPRTFPLRGRYNDYGGVDHIQGPAQQAAWLAGFGTGPRVHYFQHSCTNQSTISVFPNTIQKN